MKPVIDLTKEYGLVLEGGGAKGAYQIGAWKAMREAGVKIKGIAGTSVGALNGALICMDDLTNAEKVWENISYSSIMSVEDEKMELLFHQKKLDVDMLKSAFDFMKEGGIDVTPLKELIAECIDEEKIICEMAVSTYRAGADIYLTYFAKELAGFMDEGRIG